MQLGLGAGRLTKFCHKKLRMKTTAIELNPQVLAACRGWFKLPPDDAKLQVVLADAAQEIRNPKWQGTVDALQVDLYDHEAAAPVLDSAAFYADCRALLTRRRLHDGQPVRPRVELRAQPGEDCRAFGEDAVWAFKPTREGNTVVLAQRTPSRPKRERACRARAETIQARWDLPATKWVRVFKPVAVTMNTVARLHPAPHRRPGPCQGPLDWRRLVRVAARRRRDHARGGAAHHRPLLPRPRVCSTRWCAWPACRCARQRRQAAGHRVC